MSTSFATAVRPDLKSRKPQAATKVYLLDLAAIVPYYVGHLAVALQATHQVTYRVASVKYHLDPQFFERQGLETRPGLLDWASGLSRSSFRQGAKLLEYLTNLAATSFRCLVDRPQVVHVQFLALAKTRLPFELWFLHLAKLSGISIVYTVHNVLPHDSGDRYRERFKRIYSMADHLICHDPSARDRLVAEFDIEPRRITVIPHGPLFGVKRDALESRRRLKLSQDQLVVLWQGIMRPYKGLDVLIDAWRRLQIQGVNATLVIAGFGEPSMVQQVRELVASLPNPESVRLDLRFIDVDELETYYSAADILVYPYRDVTTSGALMTGIGHAKPIVASDLPAFRELLSHNQSALLVRSGDADELAASLRLLIESPELRQLLGRNIGKNTTNPTWDSIAAQTVEVYQTASRF